MNITQSECVYLWL